MNDFWSNIVHDKDKIKIEDGVFEYLIEQATLVFKIATNEAVFLLTNVQLPAEKVEQELNTGPMKFLAEKMYFPILPVFCGFKVVKKGENYRLNFWTRPVDARDGGPDEHLREELVVFNVLFNVLKIAHAKVGPNQNNLPQEPQQVPRVLH